MAETEFEQITRERDEATNQVVSSSHPFRLVVAGPGTGKTATFKAALERNGGGLALTFLRTLADDLEVSLAGIGTGSTFHRYAKHLIHSLSPLGLTPRFSLYPHLLELEAIDLRVLGEGTMSSWEIEKAIQDLSVSTSEPGRVLDLGSYYDAASFVDIVYRVYRHLEANQDEIPVYPLVVVDEYQDFSRLEAAFIRLLGTKSPLLVAGDDDQALYDFRHASADYIRDLARSSFVELHELPYCGRCTQVVVDAVNTTIATATSLGNLSGRLAKPFKCFLPGKVADNAAHPKILDVRCSTEKYMAQYVAREIAAISQADIEASKKGGYYTALVVGRGHFVEHVHEWLLAHGFPQALMRPRPPGIQAADAYRRLARDGGSNLGWRILVQLDPFEGWESAVVTALTSGRPLGDYVPSGYRGGHLEVAVIARAVLDGDEVDPADLALLARHLGVDSGGVAEALGASETRDEDIGPPTGEAVDLSHVGDASTGTLEPTILCTSLMGAKGLSAGHVFIVGCMDGPFPKDATNPTDKEICQFLVALSRTRQACHLVSCRVFYPQYWREPGLFVRWVEGHTERLDVDATTFNPNAKPRRPRRRRSTPRVMPARGAGARRAT